LQRGVRRGCQEPKQPITNSPGVEDYSKQQVTQSQQLEMGLTAREENQAVALYLGKSMESHSKVSLEVNKTQVLMKLSTKEKFLTG